MQIACGRGLVLLWRRYDMLCTSDFMDDVIFGRSGPYGDAWLAALLYRSGVYECFVFHYGLMLLSISQQRRKTVADTDNLLGGG